MLRGTALQKFIHDLKKSTLKSEDWDSHFHHFYIIPCFSPCLYSEAVSFLDSEPPLQKHLPDIYHIPGIVLSDENIKQRPDLISQNTSPLVGHRVASLLWLHEKHLLQLSAHWCTVAGACKAPWRQKGKLIMWRVGVMWVGLNWIRRNWSFGEGKGRAFPAEGTEWIKSRNLGSHEVCSHYCGVAKKQPGVFAIWEKALLAKHILQIWES